MSDGRSRETDSFEAFLKAGQYLVRLKSQQDVLEHVARLVVAHFPARWVAFAEKDGEGNIVIQESASRDPDLVALLGADEIHTAVADVMESGFLASHKAQDSNPWTIAFLPVVEEYETRAVMLVGHASADVLTPGLLNVYLALAGLVGTTLERLHSEEELHQHRVYLEELVRERTRELSEAQQRNELILQSVSEGICGLDPEGRIVFVNSCAARTIGWEPEALIGRDAHSTFHHTRPCGDPYPADECQVRLSISAQGVSRFGEETFLRSDGSSLPVEFATAPIVKDGAVLGAVLVFKDIAERKHADEQRERLLQKQQELGEELAAANEELHARNEELAARQGEVETQNEQLRRAQEEAARLFEQQRALLQRLQEALLHIPSELPGVRFGHLYRSATKEAQIGGDFYDVFEVRDGRVGLVIGDVSGHGVEAARMANLVKDTVHAFAHQFGDPSLVLGETNGLLVRRRIPGFVTAFLGFLDPDTGSFVYSSAGHPPPLLHVDFHAEFLESHGLPLGALDDARYRDAVVLVPRGGLLLFYTDGITEARSGDAFFGELGLRAAVERLAGWHVEILPALLLEEALAFARGRLHDDAAILAVKYVGKPEL